MATKTFWTIVVKFAGLLIGWQLLSVITQLFSVMVFYFSGSNYYEQYMFTMVLLIVQTLFYFWAAWQCLLNPAVVVKRFHLTDGMEEEFIRLNIHRSPLIKIVVIITGLLMVVNGLPDVIRYLLNIFQKSDSSNFIKDDRNFPWMIFALLKTTIGYSMVAYSRFVVNLIELRRLKTGDDPEQSDEEPKQGDEEQVQS